MNYALLFSRGGRDVEFNGSFRDHGINGLRAFLLQEGGDKCNEAAFSTLIEADDFKGFVSSDFLPGGLGVEAELAQ